MANKVVNMLEHKGVSYGFKGFEVDKELSFNVETIMDFLYEKFSPLYIDPKGQPFNEEGYLVMVIFEQSEEEVYIHVFEYRFEAEFIGTVNTLSEIMEEMEKSNEK